MKELNRNLLRVQIDTADGLTLPGQLYSHGNKKAAIYLHGNGSSSPFYTVDSRPEYAEAFSSVGVDFLEFNNRGAELIKKLYTKSGELKWGGQAHEDIYECILDIDGAIDTLKKHGYEKFYLVGESTGANKICVYNYYKKDENPVEAYLLLAGGDDVGYYFQKLGEEKFWRLLGEAKAKIDKGAGEELIGELLPTLFSYTGFYGIANPDGNYNVFPFYEAIYSVKLSQKQPLFEMFKAIGKPTLCIYGDQDEYTWGGAEKIVEILEAENPRVQQAVVKGADHEFTGKREEVGKLMAEWLVKTTSESS